ncbi:probable BOI-related E3 ubiquitin-protein ligase 3 [Andrographis paniculata]|uniref:probable BOI-related E3 ubiquitin-protein ligase 3 n=1 Tax=Andrographis paniculata TaxID=175694 RepID=UPI0021E7E5D4|nr:probable BOI-related E3 ubiquitin-protein ligase 3 [Andrographis paniculata]
MAVEARHIGALFPMQMLGNRGLMNNGVEGIGNGHGTLFGTSAAAETVAPMYGSAVVGNAPAKGVAIKSDSGVTCSAPNSRKRSRDASDPLVSSLPTTGVHNQIANSRCGAFTFLGADFSFQFLQQQLEIDRFVAQHTEKMRRETEERRKRFSRSIALTVEETILKKLKAKEEEIDKIGKLNMALEERVKSLCVENQIWRDLAQTNEATANTLRCNLEQVLAQIQDEQKELPPENAAGDDDAQSCCGSTSNKGDHCGGDDNRDYNILLTDDDGRRSRNRLCRSCGNNESSVLLLPCRHLCLCTVCGSSLHICPVCKSSKTASVHVNLTS